MTSPHSTDHTESRELGFVQLIAELMTTFIDLPPAALDGAIVDAQRRVCEFLNVEQAGIWQWSGKPYRALRLTHIHRPEGEPPLPEGMTADEMFPWCLEQMLAGRTLVVAAKDAPPEAARDKESWSYFGIKSVVLIPLRGRDGAVFGVSGFHSARDDHEWPPVLVDRLQLVAQMFASALVRDEFDRALRESEVRLSVAMEAAEAGLWSMDLDSTVVEMNPRMNELFPFAQVETVTLARFLEVIHHEDRPQVELAVRLAGRTDASLNLEFRVALPSGGLRWIAARGRRHHDAAGRWSLIGVSTDITQRKQAEAARRDSESRLASAIRVAALGFYEATAGGVVTYLDERVRELLAIPPGDEARTREYWLGRVHVEDRERVYEASHSVIFGDVNRVDVEYRYLHPTKGLLWIHHVTHVLERNPDGAVVLLIGVLQDITERRRTEEELQGLRLHFWHSDRVAQTGALAASLAHELNQPLAAILSNAQAGLRFMAQEPFDAQEIREILKDIVQDDKRAVSVISGLRSMLRGRTARRETISLAATIRVLLELVNGELLQHHVECRLDIERDGIVRADKAQMQQVILNLVMNAIQAMQENATAGRLLEIRLTEARGEAIISVRDTGPGFPDGCADKLFEAFWTTKQDGLGIGLAISRTIIESHGGRMWHETNPDRGLTFFVALPAETTNVRDQGT